MEKTPCLSSGYFPMHFNGMNIVKLKFMFYLIIVEKEHKKTWLLNRYSAQTGIRKNTI
jgi:hypothetical protein